VTHTTQLSQDYPMQVFLLASSVYWADSSRRSELFQQLEAAMSLDQGDQWKVVRIDSQEGVDRALQADAETRCVIAAMSGGVQPWMRQIGRARQQIAIFNAYLPEAIEESVSEHWRGQSVIFAIRRAGKLDFKGAEHGRAPAVSRDAGIFRQSGREQNPDFQNLIANRST